MSSLATSRMLLKLYIKVHIFRSYLHIHPYIDHSYFWPPPLLKLHMKIVSKWKWRNLREGGCQCHLTSSATWSRKGQCWDTVSLVAWCCTESPHHRLGPSPWCHRIVKGPDSHGEHEFFSSISRILSLVLRSWRVRSAPLLQSIANVFECSVDLMHRVWSHTLDHFSLCQIET